MNPPQHMQALALANEIRCGAAVRRRQWSGADGFAIAAQALREPDDLAARMKVGYFLRGLRRVGPDRARRLVLAAALPPQILIWRVGPVFGPINYDRNRELTERQRRALAAVLDDVAARMNGTGVAA